jgi:hypothetical protein
MDTSIKPNHPTGQDMVNKLLLLMVAKDNRKEVPLLPLIEQYSLTLPSLQGSTSHIS